MKKIVCLFGSPRPKGNSAAIAKRFCETAEKLGADITTFSLNKLTYRGCQACMTCKTKLEKCVLKDDLAEVLDAVRNADILVMATPTYYGEISSQMKGFVDRTFSYLVPDYTTNPKPSRLSPGKKLVFIQTQAQPEESSYADVFPRYESFLKWYGFNDNHLIRACGVSDKGEAEAREDVMKRAEDTAEKIMKSGE
ncbi:flavodoxin family protein [Desulfococcaceae bacterium HSG8]|nr:flavodoxin family protein [Desulfococcaceae bacterium HSG8]